MPFKITASNSVLFLGVFIFAFFPNLFISTLRAPFSLLAPSAQRPSTSQIRQGEATEASASHTPNTFGSNAVDTAAMSWFQKTIALPSRARGSYLITDHIETSLPEIRTYKVGILHLFVQHTSCALSLNENWDEDVRADMSDALERIVPEDKKGNLYRHSCEGPDDMPAHVKSALVGASVTVPITNGRLATGTWQGIWYLEFRAAKHSRKVVATIQGEKM